MSSSGSSNNQLLIKEDPLDQVMHKLLPQCPGTGPTPEFLGTTLKTLADWVMAPGNEVQELKEQLKEAKKKEETAMTRVQEMLHAFTHVADKARHQEEKIAELKRKNRELKVRLERQEKKSKNSKRYTTCSHGHRKRFSSPSSTASTASSSSVSLRPY